MPVRCSIVLLLLVLLGSHSCNRSSATVNGRPNVLFIAVDDLNDWTGTLGGHPAAMTPNLDRLASEGISFTNAHANCPACQPSRNSLMSGLMPATSGWYSNTFGKGMKRPVYDFIQEISTPLPAYFREQGYKTMGAGKLYHSGVAEYQEDMGVLWEETAPPYTISTYFKDTVGDGYGEAHFHPFPPGGSPINRKYGGRVPGFSLCGGPLDREKDIPNGIMHDEYISDWAVRKLEEDHHRPFFLAVGFTRPHVPYTAPAGFFEQYADREIKIPVVPDDDLRDIPIYGKAMVPSILPGGDHQTVLDMGPDYWPELVRAYLACVSFVDAQVGKLLDALENSPYAGNTIVVLWSDHGQHLGEKKHWRKMALWEESTRVPLIFRFPDGSNRGMTCSRPVSLIDLYPTLVGICGLNRNDRLEGRNLSPLLEDPDAAWDFPVVTSWMYRNWAIRSERFRYILYRDGSEELYDHRSDPGEWNNLAGDPGYAAIIDEHKMWIPDTCAYPFRLDSIPGDELDLLVGKWREQGIPGWLK